MLLSSYIGFGPRASQGKLWSVFEYRTVELGRFTLDTVRLTQARVRLFQTHARARLSDLQLDL